jgi:hypothetical protein
MILTYLAICMLSVPHQDCNRETSVAWIKAPDLPGRSGELPIACLRHGMMFAAESQLVVQGSYLRVLCVRPQPEKVPQNAG